MTIVRPTLLAALVVALTAIDALPATAQSPVPPKILFRPLLQWFGEAGPPPPPPEHVIEADSQQRAVVDRTLEAWHAASEKFPVFSVEFAHFDYNSVFNPPNHGEPEEPIRQTKGKICYASPDKASYQDDEGQKWFVAGDTVIEYNAKLTKVREYRLPKDDVGKPVTDCPYPFLYGPDPELMRRRFYLVPIDSQGRENELWIEAHPKTKQDRTFARAQFILKLPEYRLLAVNLIRANERERSAIVFGELEAPNQASEGTGCAFPKAKTPDGWKHELTDDGATGVPQWLIGTPRAPKKVSPQ